MTNKEFCARLRKAKKIAVRRYPSSWCIYYACNDAGIALGLVAIFDEGGDWQMSNSWVALKAAHRSDIAAVFDNSIRSLGEEP